MSMLVVFILTYFVVWLLVTLLSNFRILKGRPLLVCNYFFLTPNWSFFSPNPLISDFHLCYRLYKNDGSVSDFTELIYIVETKTYNIFWNSSKRKSKFIVDVIQELFEEIRLYPTKDYANLPLSFPYLLILNYITHQLSTSDTVAIQFKIDEVVNLTDKEERSLIFQSVKHEVRRS